MSEEYAKVAGVLKGVISGWLETEIEKIERIVDVKAQ